MSGCRDSYSIERQRIVGSTAPMLPEQQSVVLQSLTSVVKRKALSAASFSSEKDSDR
jgi:hypothetical protein